MQQNYHNVDFSERKYKNIAARMGRGLVALPEVALLSHTHQQGIF